MSHLPDGRPAADGDHRPPAVEQGGDPVCWLHELCPECGALPTSDVPDRCWQCGTPLPVGPRPAAD